MIISGQRHTQNLEIISLFKQKAAPNHLLKKYSGWGGLKSEIYTPAVYKELNKVLTQEEISSLKKTLNNAYYTPSDIVKFMYDWLVAYGFKGGSILEPALGHGVFIEHMPQAIKANSKVTAVELDRLTSQIAQKLYPEVEHHNRGFEQYEPEHKFDLIIGNPPYGSGRVFDGQHADLKDARIHHYFVAKSMRLLKPGGILAMVLPCYFLDNVKDHVRHIIHQEGGDLLAGYRLPDDLFADAKVTVDIVFLTKGTTGKEWLHTKDVTVAGIKKPMNGYFYHHSHNILGNLEIIDMYGRKGLTCKRRGDTARLLARVLGIVRQTRLLNLTNSLATIDLNIKSLQATQQELTAMCKDMLFLSPSQHEGNNQNQQSTF